VSRKEKKGASFYRARREKEKKRRGASNYAIRVIGITLPKVGEEEIFRPNVSLCTSSPGKGTRVAVWDER